GRSQEAICAYSSIKCAVSGNAQFQICYALPKGEIARCRRLNGSNQTQRNSKRSNRSLRHSKQRGGRIALPFSFGFYKQFTDSMTLKQRMRFVIASTMTDSMRSW